MPVKKTAVRFEERAELLDFLLEVSAITAETLDLDRLLDNVAEIIKKVIPYQLFAIMLYNDKRKTLRIKHAIGHREEICKHLNVALGEGITGLAALERQAILVPDVTKHPYYLNALDAVQSELAVPMVARGKLVGVIDIQSTKIGTFTEYDRAILKLIAARVASAIDNARLYRRVDQQNRTFKTLHRVSQEFSSLLDVDALLGKLAEIMRTLISYDSFSLFLVDEEQKVLRRKFTVRYDQRMELDNIPLGKGLTGTAALTRETVRVDDTLADPRYIASHPGIRSEVALPLILKNRVIGVLDLESEKFGHYTDEHVRILQTLAPQIAASVENARLYEEVAIREQKMEKDLQAGRKLQSVLLPSEAPEVKGLEIGIGLRPARQISGDLFDFFEHGEDNVVIAFGDSSGKGAAAALYGALVSGLLRSLAPRRRRPAELLKALNETLLERKVEAQYVTLLVIRWEATTRMLTMANAGAATPLIIRKGKILKPRAEGVPIGLLDTRDYDEVQIQMNPGDVMVLYSDGVSDGTNVDGDEFGVDRISSVMKRSSASTPKQIVDAIFFDLDYFTEGTEQFDDQTLLVLKVT